MRTITHIFSTAVTVMTVVIILVLSVFYIPRIIGIKPYMVLSGSMEPKIPTGSVVFVDTKDTDVSIGDIITYSLQPEDGEETLVTHRVIKEKEGMFITKGDANDIEDAGPVSKEQIVGSYRFLIPMAGFIISRINRKITVIAVVWIILLNGMSLALSFIYDDKK